MVRTLLESNAAFLSSTQQATADYTLYGLSLDEDLDETERAYYESSFSFALQEALERTGGDPSLYPFDEGYDEYQYSGCAPCSPSSPSPPRWSVR